jgi:adenosylhomocysteinase
MDMSFAIQALSAKYLVENKDSISREKGNMLNVVPESIDREVAFRKLDDWGIGIDHLTEKQKEYLFGNQ